MIFKYPLFVLALSIVSQVHALEQINDDELAAVTGQNGVSLSGELSLNEDGGPLTGSFDPGTGATTTTWVSCADKTDGTAQRCGTRLAVKLNKDVGSSGWLALDEMKGKVSFEGLTIRSREISVSDSFGGDETAFGGQTVLEIGLPNKVKFENYSYSVVTSSTARPTDTGFTQQTRYGVDFNGTVNMQGNLLVFPTGNP